MSATAQAEM
jgi:hypothetical protein